MSETPDGPKPPNAPKPLQFLAVTALVAIIAGTVFALRQFGASVNTVSMTVTILCVGSLMVLSRRYGSRSVPVLGLMFWVVVASIAMVIAIRG
jgi:hypothetical protein